MHSQVRVAVVGSLLDNVPNMAGLVRTAESLLGAQAEVTLRTDKVLQDGNFTKMSVAAERACGVVAVPVSSRPVAYPRGKRSPSRALTGPPPCEHALPQVGARLVAYLREKRSEGFSVVALEQTSSSEILCASTTLPAKMVALVGSEAHGVPAWLMHSGLVDRYVELPLLGQTRSLNAHVATAMLLWHYQLQHLQLGR